MARIRLPAGRQRIDWFVSPTEKHYTRQMRAQMEGVLKNLQKVIDSIEDASPQGLLYAVQPIYDESQRLVPVDTGDLRASGFIETRRRLRGAQVVVGYARGGRPHYAALVHERLDFFHQPPTQAKYLEEPAVRNLGNILPRYIEFVQRDTGLTS